MAPGLLQGRGADINSLSRRHVFSSPIPRSLSSYLLHRNIRDLDPLSLEGADGMWYILQNGRRVLDGSGGAGVSSIGHKDLRVLKANTAHFNTGVHYAPGDFMSDPVLKLSRLLVNSTDGDLRRAVFYNSGMLTLIFV
jgi:adenosylmethionine-8-amino-7-oxononanoate aminotransferase